MIFFRIYALISIVMIASFLIAYFRGANKRYLRWAGTTLVTSTVIAAVFFAVLVADRVWGST